MTTEQLEKANELNKKISTTESFIANLKKRVEQTSNEKAEAVLFKLAYQAGGNFTNFEMTPTWINDKDVRADFIKMITAGRDQAIEFLEADLGLMKKELQNL